MLIKSLCVCLIYNCILTIDCIIVPPSAWVRPQIQLNYHKRHWTSAKSTKQRYFTSHAEMPLLVRTRLLPLQPAGNSLPIQCAFAHTEDELRTKAQLNHHYKTKLCANFKNHGFCKYGERCQFLHLQEAPTTYFRPTEPQPSPISDCRSETLSTHSTETDGKKHQKTLMILSDYGLDVLTAYSKRNIGKGEDVQNIGAASLKEESIHTR